MTTYPITTRRLILAGGFALAIAITPAVAILAHPTHSVPLAACDPGEEEDPPHLGGACDNLAFLELDIHGNSPVCSKCL